MAFLKAHIKTFDSHPHPVRICTSANLKSALGTNIVVHEPAPMRKSRKKSVGLTAAAP